MGELTKRTEKGFAKGEGRKFDEKENACHEQTKFQRVFPKKGVRLQ